MRLGKWIYSLPDVLSDIEDLKITKGRDPWVNLSLINSILAVMTDFCDDVGWCGSYGLVPEAVSERFERFGVFCWFLTCIFDITLSVRDMQVLQARIREAERKGDEDAIRRLKDKRVQLSLSLVKFSCDLCVSFPSAFEFEGVNKGFLLVGALSSGSAALLKLLIKEWAAQKERKNKKML